MPSPRICQRMVLGILVSAAVLGPVLSADPPARKLDSKVFGARDVEEFLSAEVRHRQVALDQLVNDRRELATRLGKLIASQRQTLAATHRIDPRSIEAHAARLGGKLKLESMASILSTYLGVRETTFHLRPTDVGFGQRFLITDFSYFPMAVAMKDIGMPAVKHLLTSIEVTDDDHLSTTHFELSVVTLSAILGKELAEAAVNEEAKDNLQYSLEKLKAVRELIDQGEYGWKASLASDYKPGNPKVDDEDPDSP